MAKQPKALLINGSPRHANGLDMLHWVQEELEKEGVAVEIYQLGGKEFKPCKSCWACRRTGKCVQDDPVINELCAKMVEADAIVIGSPTYYADVSMEVKGMMDRCGLIVGSQLKRKIGAAVVSARRGGAIHVFDTINHWFTINQMIIVGSSYWNDGYNPHTTQLHEVLEDQEAQNTMRNLGINIAWLLKKIAQ